MNKSRPSWPWIVAVLGLPVLYVASFGPACWTLTMNETHLRVFTAIYHPIFTVSSRSHQAGGLVDWYSAIGRRDGAMVVLVEGEELATPFKPGPFDGIEPQ